MTTPTFSINDPAHWQETAAAILQLVELGVQITPSIIALIAALTAPKPIAQ